MIRKFILLPAVFLLSLNVHANGVDFKIGSEAAEFIYQSESSTFGYGGADVGMGIFWDEFDNYIASGSMLVSGSSAGEVRALHFGVGAKVYLVTLDTQPESTDGAALAIGGQMRYVFPSSTPIAILLEGFIAPSVTSVGDFEGILEYRFAVELEVTPSARAYVGYRKFEITPEGGGPVDYELDDEAHIGVRFSF